MGKRRWKQYYSSCRKWFTCRSTCQYTAADFEKETGCKVVVDAVAYTGMYDKLSTEIKAGQAAHDVSCMDFVWLAAFADAIEPITDADTSDFLPTLEESGTVDGNLLDIRCG